jgi:ribose transport system permease protein
MKKRSLLKRAYKGKTLLMICLIAVIMLITYIFKPTSFTSGNAKQILSVVSYLGMMGIGVACLLMGGELDFATSAHASVAIMIFAEFMHLVPGIPWIVALLTALLFGAIAGGINALLVEGLHLTSFIATIGMASVWGGLTMWYTRGGTIAISNETVAKLTSATIGGTPVPWVFVFVVFVLIAYTVILNRTRFGRSVLMIGGNAMAARLAGLNPVKIKSLLYINNGLLAAVSALIWVSQNKIFVPKGLTQTMPEITALTAAILGGVSFMGGEGHLSGAFFGIILLQVLSYSLQILNLPLWLVTMVNGLLLLIALMLDILTSRKRKKGMGIH